VRVSVVVPTYDRASVLLRAIDSVLAQSHEHLELLVCDDGSSDDTKRVVAAYDDDRIRYLPGDNRGANAPRNRGIEAVRSSRPLSRLGRGAPLDTDRTGDRGASG